jgi:hypothetical protein
MQEQHHGPLHIDHESVELLELEQRIDTGSSIDGGEEHSSSSSLQAHYTCDILYQVNPLHHSFSLILLLLLYYYYIYYYCMIIW